MKLINRIALLTFALATATATVAQDLSFSQTYEAPLYLSPSFTGLTNGSRFGLNYRNQWPGVGNVYQVYSVAADHYFDRYNSGLGLLWVCDNQGKGLLTDNQISFLYAYEFSINKDLFVRPGLGFHFGQRKVNRGKMISYTDITSDGQYAYGGSSIEFERTKKMRFDAGASVMVYNDNFWVGVAVDHLLQPDVSFTDTESEIGMKITGYAGYKITYEPSYRGSEPKTITFGVNYKHQYSYNQLEIGAYWYYSPIEIGVMYRGLFFKVAEEIDNSDAIVPSLGVNIGALRIGYSYDVTLSDMRSYGNGAHEVSVMYRLIPPDVRRRSYKMKPVPCTEPIMGYSYTGQGKKYAKKRKFLKK